MAEVVTAPPAEVAEAQPTVADATALPATSSMLPLIGLMGLMAMGAALALRAVSKQA